MAMNVWKIRENLLKRESLGSGGKKGVGRERETEYKYEVERSCNEK